MGGHNFQVASVALQTEQALYPASRPGLVWVTPADAASLANPIRPARVRVGRQADAPIATDAFYNGAAFNATNNALIGSSISQSWQAIRG